MKNREGFVSNSSSTSFTFAVNTRNKKCKTCKFDRNIYDELFLDLLDLYATSDRENVSEVLFDIKSIKSNIKECQDNINWAKNEIKYVESLNGNYLIKIAQERLSELLTNLNTISREDVNKSWAIQTIKESSKYKTYSDPFFAYIKTLDKIIKDNDKKIQKLKDKHEIIKKFSKPGVKFYTVEIDNWTSPTGALIKKMLNSGHIDVVEKICK